jgi:hypothetical protein
MKRMRGEPFGRVPTHRLPKKLIDQIEAWRLAQPIPPSKIDTLIHLLELGLKAAEEQS